MSSVTYPDLLTIMLTGVPINTERVFVAFPLILTIASEGVGLCINSVCLCVTVIE